MNALSNALTILILSSAALTGCAVETSGDEDTTTADQELASAKISAGRYNALSSKRSFARNDSTGETDFYELTLSGDFAKGDCFYQLSVQDIDCGSNPCTRSDMDDPANRSTSAGLCRVNASKRTLELLSERGDAIETYRFEAQGTSLDLVRSDRGMRAYRNSLKRTGSAPKVNLFQVGWKHAANYAQAGRDNNYIQTMDFDANTHGLVDHPSVVRIPVSGSSALAAAKDCAFLTKGAFGTHISASQQDRLANAFLSDLKSVGGSGTQFFKLPNESLTKGDVVASSCAFMARASNGDAIVVSGGAND